MPLGIPEAEARQWLRRAIAQAHNIAAAVDESAVDASLAWATHADHHLLTIDDARYPALLKEIADPPPALFARGRLDLLNAECLSVVGSRNATAQGTRDARAFAADLSSRGICIVSGLALGIDAAAHHGGLSGPGSSIAVLGTGPEQRYPPLNRDLQDVLARDGCVVTEFPPGTQPRPRHFPQRNRIISGLSRGVLVVEAAPGSGSLVTAYRAAAQNREVFVLPGSIHAPLSKGCHSLIREGAVLVTEAEHIVEDIATWRRFRRKPSPGRTTAAHPFLDAMGFAPTTLDAVARSTGIEPREIAATLARLELEGLVQRLAGGLYQRSA